MSTSRPIVPRIESDWVEGLEGIQPGARRILRVLVAADGHACDYKTLFLALCPEEERLVASVTRPSELPEPLMSRIHQAIRRMRPLLPDTVRLENIRKVGYSLHRLHATGDPPEKAATPEMPSSDSLQPLDEEPALTTLLQSAMKLAKERGQNDLAKKLIARAKTHQERARHLRADAAQLRLQALALLQELPRWASRHEKLSGLELQARCTALLHAAEIEDASFERLLLLALQLTGNLEEAQNSLADHFLGALTQAERNLDQTELHRREAQFSTFGLEQHSAYLERQGLLTLLTEPPGAVVVACRQVEHLGVWKTVERRPLGKTPLVRLELEPGPYQIELTLEERAPVIYPVLLTRTQPWDCLAPGALAPSPIFLPQKRDVSEGECYVPAGWAWVGARDPWGDDLPWSRVWVPGFIMERNPVTNDEYIDYLNSLVSQGNEDQAMEDVPRERGGRPSTAGAMLYGRHSDGLFFLGRDAEGTLWRPKHPVVHITWSSAKRFADWRAAHDGKPWRLPKELEWEKAARGVDGRSYPWGESRDHSLACVAQSRPPEYAEEPPEVTEHCFPTDVSSYGIWGLAGCCSTWCQDELNADGSPRSREVDYSPILYPALSHLSAIRSVRGGHWYSPLRPAWFRQVFSGNNRIPTLGLRLTRSYP